MEVRGPKELSRWGDQRFEDGNEDSKMQKALVSYRIKHCIIM